MENLSKVKLPNKINIILEGGCLNGAYEIGGLLLIKKLEQTKQLKIKRISGSSVGAYSAFLFLIDKLDSFIEQYKWMRNDFKKHASLSALETQLHNLTTNLSNNEFKKIQRNKLFIKYYDIKSCRAIIKHKFKTREELKNTILKSCQLPFLINNQLFYKEKGEVYFDGGMPFIFNYNIFGLSCVNIFSGTDPIHKQERKTLYMSLSQHNKINRILNIKNEFTIHGRIFEGLLDTYNFFLKGQSTEMCSFVSEWTAIDHIKYLLLHIIYTIIIYLLHYIHKIYGIIMYNFMPMIKSMQKSKFYMYIKPKLVQKYRAQVVHWVFN